MLSFDAGRRYVDPEIAHVGMYEEELKRRDIPHDTYLRPLEHVDRYKCEGEQVGCCAVQRVARLGDSSLWRGTKQACSSPPILTTPSPGHVQEGFVKIHVEAGTDKLLGATIVASNAGDMISELTLCMQVRS